MFIKKPKFWDGPGLSFWAFVTYPLSLITKLINILREISAENKAFPINIVCIGNINIGGTGKTPTSIAIYKILKSMGKKPVFIKKYYNFLKDEIEMLKEVGPVIYKNTRKEALENAVKKKYDFAILDDGFQDFSIKKNFSILCFNSKQMIGNGLVLPSGPLRESTNGIDRADFLIINGSRAYKKNFFYKKKIPIIKSFFKIKNLGKFKKKKFIAFAGIGNPSNFFDLLKENKINIVKSYSFPDHYKFLNQDIKKMHDECKKKNLSLITTEKDYFRLNKEMKKKCDFLKIEVHIDKKKDLRFLLNKFK